MDNSVESPPATDKSGKDGSAEKSCGDIGKLLQDPTAFAQALAAGGGLPEVLSLPVPVKQRVQALKKMQLEAVKMEAEFYKKVHDLECEFADKFIEMNKKRKNIVTGEYEPTKEEYDFPLLGCPADEQNLSVEMEEKAKLENGGKENGVPEGGDAETIGIPNFWLQLLRNVDLVADMIQEHDENILKHLLDIDVKLFKPPEQMGFHLVFHFSPNEYFTNTVLTKEYVLRCDPDETDPFEFDGPEIISSKGTKIEWNAGKNVTVKMIKKKQKNKAKGQTRFVTREVKNDSFFNFFDPPPTPEGDVENMDEETRELLNADFEIGQLLRDRVVPRAVLYFTGEVPDESFDGEDDEFEDEEEDEDDDEDDDEDPKA